MIDDHGKSQADASPVQFGIFDWIDRNQLPLSDLYEQRLRCLEYADEAGFYCYHLAEHQATPLGMAPSPGVFLSAAIQRTRHIRLGPLVYLLPLYNPLRLVQEICMLDHMSQAGSKSASAAVSLRTSWPSTMSPRSRRARCSGRHWTSSSRA